MTLKEEIQALLKQLKSKGVDRRRIEADLEYRVYYIDQMLSNGGTEIFLNRLKKYAENTAIANSLIKESSADNLINRLVETAISLRAEVNILRVTVAHLASAEKEVSLVSAEMQQAIDLERDRIFAEWST